MNLTIYNCSEPGLSPCRCIIVGVKNLETDYVFNVVIFLKEKHKLTTINTLRSEYLNAAKLDDDVDPSRLILINDYIESQKLEIKEELLKLMIIPELLRFIKRYEDYISILQSKACNTLEEFAKSFELYDA